MPRLLVKGRRLFEEAFALLVRHGAIRMLLRVAASKHMHAKHLGIKTEFLHRENCREAVNVTITLHQSEATRSRMQAKYKPL